MKIEKKCKLCNHTNKIIDTDIYTICSKCLLLYYNLAKSISYEDDYFGKEYKNQYGKEYIEDKPNIQNKNNYRLQYLDSIFKKNKIDYKNKRVLEIGSAAGFFLDIMQQKGCSIQGWEISSVMGKIANSNGISTIVGNFEELFLQWKTKQENQYDIVAAFYVIEHINDPNFVWQAFSSLIKPGGYLLLAMPSYWGPTFYFNKKQWIATHPIDHFVDYSIRSIKKISKQYFFSLKFKTADGVHPYRFPFGTLFIFKHIYSYIQKKIAFADTIYIILQKQK